MNNNYLFHVDYYNKIAGLSCSGSLKNNDFKLIPSTMNDSYIKSCNNKLNGQPYESTDEEIYIPGDKHINSFVFKTQYPGLLFGLGNSHESGSTDKTPEIKLGFTLDYVTGLPYIPGSTVKGVLRSMFAHHPEVIMEILSSFDGLDKGAIEKQDYIKKLDYEIFGGVHPYQKKSIKLNETEIKALADNKEYGGIDTFLDVFPVKTGKDDRLLGLDVVTPHKAKDSKFDGLTEPNPITMLKVIPEVNFLFRFNLQDGKYLSAEKKRELFISIIAFFGIGAKTNAGFGSMAEVAEKKDTYYLLKPKLNISRDQVAVQTAGTGKVGSASSATVNQPQRTTPVCKTCGKEVTNFRTDGTPYPLCWTCHKKGQSKNNKSGNSTSGEYINYDKLM